MSAESFDKAAKCYDEDFTFSEIGKRQRKLVYNHIVKTLDGLDIQNVLELNGGTGEDALWFRGKGHKVHFTDISPDMVEVARSKIGESKEQNTGTISYEVLDIKNVSSVNCELPIDLVFSNFGGFNCLSLDELESFFTKVGDILSPTGSLVLVIMPKNCLWENLWFSLKREWAKLRRRKKPYVMAKVGEQQVKTYYHNPNEIENLLPSRFTVSHVVPIGFFLPPSYLESLFVRRKWLLNGFYKLDSLFKSFAFLARYSDHYLIEIKTK